MRTAPAVAVYEAFLALTGSNRNGWPRGWVSGKGARMAPENKKGAGNASPPRAAQRRKSDPGKAAIAARLRKETTLPIKWIAARVQIGTSKGANSVLFHLANEPKAGKVAVAPCAQLQFRSMVGMTLV